MTNTGKELRRQMIYAAAQDYQHWQDRKRFWRRVSIISAILAVFFAGVAVGGALS
jgi:hypothetical protein